MVLEMSGNKVMRVLRESNGFTQEYVGNYLGIEQNTYSKLESGQIRLTTDRVKLLAELYHVDPDYFLTDEIQIINNNSGEGSKSYTKNTFNNENYHETDISILRTLYDKIVADKDELISGLREDLAATRAQLSDLINKLAGKL